MGVSVPHLNERDRSHTGRPKHDDMHALVHLEQNDHHHSYDVHSDTTAQFVTTPTHHHSLVSVK